MSAKTNSCLNFLKRKLRVSTYRDGTPFGNQRFVWVDTDTKSWHYAEDKL